MRANIKQLVSGFLLLIVLGAVAVWLVILSARVFSDANASTQAAIIAGLVGVFSLLFTYWKERTRALKEAHRDKKIEVYSKFYDLIFGILERIKESKLEQAAIEEEMSKAWFDISRGILFYGSPAVVAAFTNFKTQDNPDGSEDSISAMRNIGRILLAMRDDIGLSNRGLDEMSIHQIYVKDDLRKIGQTT
jgi:hypothetical protein